MRPAQAMGLFLQTWRAEWAGLTRAQLALAVSARLRRRDAVTVRVIRRWEEGQPPKTTEELEGLCQVMQRSGLRRSSVRDYRNSVYAAVTDHQYPELFGGPPLSERPDVEDLARGMFERWASHLVLPDAVQLVALHAELKSALFAGARVRVSHCQTRAQRAAYCYLLPLIGETAFTVSWRVTVGMCLAGSNAVQAYFGPSGVPGNAWLDPKRLLTGSLGTAAAHGRCRSSAKALLAMCRDGLAQGGSADWAGRALGTINDLSRIGEAVYPELRPEAERWWEIARDGLPAETVRACRVSLLDIACRHGLLAEAEEHLAELEPWRDADNVYQEWWYDYAATFAAAAGRVSQAEELYAKGLDAAVRHDDPFYYRHFARQLGLRDRRVTPAS